jgi:putative PEP-CTERM system TPR-repeat lipoprotein
MSFNRITPFLIALLVAVLAGCSVSTDPATLIAKAQTFRQKGDYASAIIELRNALQANPENAEARYLLGTAYLESGEAAFATVELQKALTGGYDPKKVLPDLAKSLIVQEKFKEALEATDPASVPSAQGSPEIMTIRAYAQILSKQLAAGKASLDLAMVLRPDYPDALLLQARIALGERDTEKATTLVDRAIAVDPKNVDAWILKAALQRQSAHPDQARISLQKAIEINQRSAAARIELASLEIENKRYEDAARELEALREIAPKNVMGLYLQALLELRTGNNKAAVETAYRAMELAPKHVPSTLLAGIAELAMGNPEKAKKYLSTALEIDSRNVYGRKMLAATQMKSGQYGQAIATLEPILDQSASDPQLLALAGEAYMQNKQFAKATQYFEKAAALDPRNAATRISLGLSRMAMGANDRAMADLEAASALGTGGARADITLATIHIQRKEFDQALKVIAKLEKTQPNNAVLYNMKATAYAGKGDTAQARAQYERALQIAPTFLPAASNLAQLDLQAGNVAAARKRYESVLEKDKSQVPAMLALADVISRTRGPEKEVLDWIQKAKTAAPDAKEPVRAEIEHYRRTGQLDKGAGDRHRAEEGAPGRPRGARSRRQAAHREGPGTRCGRCLRRPRGIAAEFPRGTTRLRQRSVAREGSARGEQYAAQSAAVEARISRSPGAARVSGAGAGSCGAGFAGRPRGPDRLAEGPARVRARRRRADGNQEARTGGRAVRKGLCGAQERARRDQGARRVVRGRQAGNRGSADQGMAGRKSGRHHDAPAPRLRETASRQVCGGGGTVQDRSGAPAERSRGAQQPRLGAQ